MTNPSPLPLFLLLISLALPACRQEGKIPSSTGSPENDQTPPRVLTTFYPTQYFSQRIAQDALTIDCPLPADADPIFWNPQPEVIQAYQQADLIVVNGASFEKWLTKVTLPAGKIVDSAIALKDDLLYYENAVVHKHGPEGEHSHEGVDGHTWVDPINAISQAREIARALSERWPAQADTFAGGLAGLEKDMLALDTRLQAFAKAWQGPPLLASHPAYNYLAKRYGLPFINLDLDPESVPPQEDLDEIQHHVSDENARYLLWESSPQPEVAQAIEGLGLQNVLFSPCEVAPDSGEDYLTVMQNNLQRLEDLLN